jgi:hypothetical protein
MIYWTFNHFYSLSSIGVYPWWSCCFYALAVIGYGVNLCRFRKGWGEGAKECPRLCAVAFLFNWALLRADLNID